MTKLKSAIHNFLERIQNTPALLVLSTEIIFGALVGFLTFHAFWEMSETVLQNEKFFFDNSISSFFYNIRDPFLTSTMEIISFIGMTGTLIFSVLIVLIFIFKKKIHEAILFSVLIGGGLILNPLLKLATTRPRPTLDPLIAENFYSFPSGHSMNSFIFFMTLAYFYYHFSRNKRLSLWTFFIAGIIVNLVGISRIYLGVHYPSDVLAGYLAGFLWLIFVLLIDKTLIFFRLFKH